MDLKIVVNKRIGLEHFAVHQIYMFDGIDLKNSIYYYSHTYYINFNTLFIVKDFIFNFFKTYSMDLKMVFSAKIQHSKLYNFAVHQIYIIWWNNISK